MKIGFDAKRITHNKTGLGNYGRYIVNSLSYYYPENEYLLYTFNKGEKPLTDELYNSSNIQLMFPADTYILNSIPFIWRSYGITKDLVKDKIDIFHGLTNELPLNINSMSIGSVVTIHDLIFLRYPQYYKFIDRQIYHYKFKEACLNANRIIAISDCTRKDIISLFKIPERKIDVVYQGCNPIFAEPVTCQVKDELREKYNITFPYLLYVGSIEERKNVFLIIRALEEIKEDIHLILIGKRTSYLKKLEKYIQEHQLTTRIHIYNDIKTHELPAFYQTAEIFIYPSLYEGFGIPILEALMSETPVIAASGSCLEEAGGPHSLYTDPYNYLELKEIILSILQSSLLRSKMKKEGKQYAMQFSSDNIARDIKNVYKKI